MDEFLITNGLKAEDDYADDGEIYLKFIETEMNSAMLFKVKGSKIC